MAGGVKKPVNIFKLKNTGEPKQVFNWRLWFAVFAFGLLGAGRGVDEGLVNGILKSTNFQKTIGWEHFSKVEQANVQGNISSMVQIGSVGGALIAFLICDRVGRLWATRELCLVWAVGIAMFMGNRGSLGLIYAGRFIAGLGIGQTVVVGPVYLAEIAPPSIRGLCTCVFTGFVYLGIVLSYFTNYGSSVHFPNGVARWEVPISLHLIFATLVFTLSIFQYESPRYLVSKGKKERAAKNLSILRGLPAHSEYVMAELHNINLQWDLEQETTRGQGFLGLFKEIFLDRSILYRLYLGVGAQFLSQWSGAGSITIYAVNLFSLLGVQGTNESLLVTGVFGIVKLVGAVVCALFLVDVIGRKRSLLLGITLQAIAVIYIAGFLTAVPQLGVKTGFKLPAHDKGASSGAIFMIYLSGLGWSLGWNSLQYLLTAELFPLRVRATCTSIIMCLHFANQYANARAVPNMLLPKAEGGINPSGTFWTFSAITVFGGLWVWFTVPETAGRDLESMNRLFALPWYKIGLYGNKDAEICDQIQAEKTALEANHVEYVEEEAQNDGKQVVNKGGFVQV